MRTYAPVHSRCTSESLLLYKLAMISQDLLFLHRGMAMLWYFYLRFFPKGRARSGQVPKTSALEYEPFVDCNRSDSGFRPVKASDYPRFYLFRRSYC